MRVTRGEIINDLKVVSVVERGDTQLITTLCKHGSLISHVITESMPSDSLACKCKECDSLSLTALGVKVRRQKPEKQLTDAYASTVAREEQYEINTAKKLKEYNTLVATEIRTALLNSKNYLSVLKDTFSNDVVLMIKSIIEFMPLPQDVHRVSLHYQMVNLMANRLFSIQGNAIAAICYNDLSDEHLYYLFNGHLRGEKGRYAQYTCLKRPGGKEAYYQFDYCVYKVPMQPFTVKSFVEGDKLLAELFDNGLDIVYRLLLRYWMEQPDFVVNEIGKASISQFSNQLQKVFLKSYRKHQDVELALNKTKSTLRVTGVQTQKSYTWQVRSGQKRRTLYTVRPNVDSLSSEVVEKVMFDLVYEYIQLSHTEWIEVWNQNG